MSSLYPLYFSFFLAVCSTATWPKLIVDKCRLEHLAPLATKIVQEVRPSQIIIFSLDDSDMNKSYLTYVTREFAKNIPLITLSLHNSNKKSRNQLTKKPTPIIPVPLEPEVLQIFILRCVKNGEDLKNQFFTLTKVAVYPEHSFRKPKSLLIVSGIKNSAAVEDNYKKLLLNAWDQRFLDLTIVSVYKDPKFSPECTTYTPNSLPQIFPRQSFSKAVNLFPSKLLSQKNFSIKRQLMNSSRPKCDGEDMRFFVKATPALYVFVQHYLESEPNFTQIVLEPDQMDLQDFSPRVLNLLVGNDFGLQGFKYCEIVAAMPRASHKTVMTRSEIWISAFYQLIFIVCAVAVTHQVAVIVFRLSGDSWRILKLGSAILGKTDSAQNTDAKRCLCFVLTLFSIYLQGDLVQFSVNLGTRKVARTVQTFEDIVHMNKTIFTDLENDFLDQMAFRLEDFNVTILRVSKPELNTCVSEIPFRADRVCVTTLDNLTQFSRKSFRFDVVGFSFRSYSAGWCNRAMSPYLESFDKAVSRSTESATAGAFLLGQKNLPVHDIKRDLDEDFSPKTSNDAAYIAVYFKIAVLAWIAAWLTLLIEISAFRLATKVENENDVEKDIKNFEFTVTAPKSEQTPAEKKPKFWKKIFKRASQKKVPSKIIRQFEALSMSNREVTSDDPEIESSKVNDASLKESQNLKLPEIFTEQQEFGRCAICEREMRKVIMDKEIKTLKKHQIVYVVDVIDIHREADG